MTRISSISTQSLPLQLAACFIPSAIDLLTQRIFTNRSLSAIPATASLLLLSRCMPILVTALMILIYSVHKIVSFFISRHRDIFITQRILADSIGSNHIQRASEFDSWFQDNQEALQKIIRLSLFKENLSTIPATICQLSNLQILGLSANDQLTRLPSEIKYLTNLQTLYLNSSPCSKDLPPEISHLTNLQCLGLGYRDLSTLPVLVLTLLNLKELELSYISSFPQGFSNLTNLQTLSLFHSQSTLSSDICFPPNLQELQLHHCRLTSFPKKILLLTKLTRLFLGNNSLQTLPSLEPLLQLKDLYLCENRFTRLPASICNLSCLVHLDLSRNRLTRLPDLSQLTNLRVLLLGGNRLTRLPATLNQLINLEALNLTENRLTALPPTLSQLRNLRLLLLLYNRLPDLPDAIYHLHEECQIIAMESTLR